MCSHDSTNGPMCRASGRCRFPARVQPLWHQLSLSRRLLNGSDGSPCCAKTPASFWLRASPAYAPARLGVCNQRCVRSGLRPRVPAAPWYSAVVGGSVGQTEPAAKTARGGGPKNKRVMHALLWTRPLKLKASQRTAPPPSRICSRRLKCHSNTSTGRRSSENRLVLLGQNS